MIKRTLALLAILLIYNHAAPAQDVKPQPGATPSGAQPPAGGGGAAQPGGQPSKPGGLAGGSGSPGGLGGEGQADGKKKKDSVKMFDFLAKGRTYFLATETKSLREPLEEFLKERGITNGQVTRELYTQFTDQMKTKMPGGTATGQGMGGFGGGPRTEKDIKAMTLEELLAKALKDNPDIRVAESKVRDAEAAMNRARLLVHKEIAGLHEEIMAKREIVAEAESRLEIEKKLKGGQRDLADARLTFVHAKFDLAKLESELLYLVGKQPATMAAPVGGGSGFGGMMAPGGGGGGFPPMGDARDWRGNPMGAGAIDYGAPKGLPGSLADKVRAALDAPIKGEFRDSKPREIVDWLSKQFKGINVHVTAKIADSAKVTLTLTEPIPTGAALQWLEDELGLRCVLRDYGIVIAERDRVPPGATPLLDYWKKSKSAESKPK